MKRVLIISDSLGLPRMEPEPVLIDETWPQILSAQVSEMFPGLKHKFYFHCMFGLNTEQLVHEVSGFLQAYPCDIVIIQVGIVDAYPRALKKSELAILSRVPYFNKLFHRVVKRFYSQLIRWRNISYVNREDFKSNLECLLTYLSDKTILMIPIAPPTEVYKQKNPRISQNIYEYNEILASVFGDSYLGEIFHELDEEFLFLSDGYHLSVQGNYLLADKLACLHRVWTEND